MIAPRLQDGSPAIVDLCDACADGAPPYEPATPWPVTRCDGCGAGADPILRLDLSRYLEDEDEEDSGPRRRRFGDGGLTLPASLDGEE